MTANAVTCVAGILLCLSLLSMTTWAWFSDTAVTGSGMVHTADFHVEITITDVNDTSIPETSQGVHCTRYSLSAGEYDISLSGKGTAQHGYCRLEIAGKTYYTQPLVTNGEELTFTITVTDEQVLDIYSNWGSYSGLDTIGQGATLNIEE